MIFKSGLYIVGFSQGGIIANILATRCDVVKNNLNRLILMGTPTAGNITPKNDIIFVS